MSIFFFLFFFFFNDRLTKIDVKSTVYLASSYTTEQQLSVSLSVVIITHSHSGEITFSLVVTLSVVFCDNELMVNKTVTLVSIKVLV